MKLSKLSLRCLIASTSPAEFRELTSEGTSSFGSLCRLLSIDRLSLVSNSIPVARRRVRHPAEQAVCHITRIARVGTALTQVSRWRKNAGVVNDSPLVVLADIGGLAPLDRLLESIVGGNPDTVRNHPFKECEVSGRFTQQTPRATMPCVDSPLICSSGHGFS